MDSKTKKILIISGIVAGIGAIIAFIIYNGKKTAAINPITGSGMATTTAVSPTGAPVTAAQASASTSGAVTNPWIRFNWTGGNKALQYSSNGYTDLGYTATGFQLSNVAELPTAIGPGTKVEIKMEPASQQDLNGIHTVLYLGDDTQPGNFMSGAGALITVDFKNPINPNKLPNSGYFRVV